MKKVAIWITAILMTAGLTGGSVYFWLSHKVKKTEGQYHSNTLNISERRMTKGGVLGPNSTVYFEAINDNWLRYINADVKYSVEIPDKIFSNVFGDVPTIIIQHSQNDSYLWEAYKPVEPWNLLEVKIPKNTERVKVLTSYSDVEYGSTFRSFYTANATTDQEIIAAANEYFGDSCVFTSVTRKPSTATGINDIILTASNANSSSCPFLGQLNQSMKDYDYRPDVIKFSSSLHKIMFSGGSQGCRWTLADSEGTCADDRIFNSFKFEIKGTNTNTTTNNTPGTYKNDRYGIAFSFPENLKMDKIDYQDCDALKKRDIACNQNIDTILNLNLSNTIKKDGSDMTTEQYSINLTKTKFNTLKEWFSDYQRVLIQTTSYEGVDMPAPTVESQEIIKVSGHDAMKLTLKGMPYGDMLYVIKYGDNLLQISNPLAQMNNNDANEQRTWLKAIVDSLELSK